MRVRKKDSLGGRVILDRHEKAHDLRVVPTSNRLILSLSPDKGRVERSLVRVHVVETRFLERPSVVSSRSGDVRLDLSDKEHTKSVTTSLAHHQTTSENGSIVRYQR